MGKKVFRISLFRQIGLCSERLRCGSGGMGMGRSCGPGRRRVWESGEGTRRVGEEWDREETAGGV